MSEQPRSDELDAGVRRTVGVAALRKLRRMVDAERAQDQADAAALKPIVILVLILVVLAVALGAIFWSPRGIS